MSRVVGAAGLLAIVAVSAGCVAGAVDDGDVSSDTDTGASTAVACNSPMTVDSSKEDRNGAANVAQTFTIAYQQNPAGSTFKAVCNVQYLPSDTGTVKIVGTNGFSGLSKNVTHTGGVSDMVTTVAKASNAATGEVYCVASATKKTTKVAATLTLYRCQ